ncbi:MAG: type VI secretion system ATPase TssH, partial [Fidelibacterota bacterium]
REGVREEVTGMLGQHFRPEFLNRVDETILFKPLTLTEIVLIVDLLVDDLRQRLSGWTATGRGKGITLELTKAARQHIASKGYDPVFGARPLKRYLQRELETRIGRAIVGGEIAEGCVIHVEVKQGELVVKAQASKKEPEEPEPVIS